MPNSEPTIYSSSELIIEYADMPASVNEYDLFIICDEIVEAFLDRLTMKLNEKLPGKWLAREKH